MKNQILILIILLFICNIIAFTTEYPELVDNLSGEWQKAGISVDSPTNNVVCGLRISSYEDYELFNEYEAFFGSEIQAD